MPPKKASGAPAPKKGQHKTRKREKKNVPHGAAHIKSTRKSTPFAAQLAAENAARKAQEHGVRKVDVFVKGPGSGRETAIRSLQAAGLEVGAISDVTPQPHNGVRPPKRRRV